MRTSAHRVLGTKMFIVILATRFHQKILRIFAQTRLFRDFLRPLRHAFFTRWSSGYVTGLSRRRPGFKSHSGQTFYLSCVKLFSVFFAGILSIITCSKLLIQIRPALQEYTSPFALHQFQIFFLI